MKYTKEQRYEIGRRIYNGVLTVNDAAAQYEVSFYTARDYLRMYKSALRRDAAGKSAQERAPDLVRSPDEGSDAALAAYEKSVRTSCSRMSREELEDELVEIKLREERIRRVIG